MSRTKHRAELLYRYLIIATKRLTDRQLMILLAIVVGLAAGLATYVFQHTLEFFRFSLTSWFDIDKASVFYFFYPVVGIVIATLFVRYVVRDDISEGVTRVLYAMSKKGSRIKPHNCYSSIIASSATIGFGGSVGPEAPIVLTGSAIGSNIGRFMRMNYKNSTLLLCCGAAAALSAVFKAPITGVVFVLEILMLDITVASIIPLLISTVTATTLMFFLNGFEPVFNLDVKYAFQLRNLPYYALLGLICGLMSYYFTQINGRIAARFARIRGMYRKWIVGGLLIGTLIFLFPPLYGEGYESLVDLMHDAFSESRRDVGHQRSGRRRRLVRPFAVRRRVYRRDDGLHAERPARPRAADHPVHARRHGRRDVGRDESSADIDLPDRRTDERIRAVRAADARLGPVVRRRILSGALLDLHEKTVAKRRAADAQQGPLGARFP